MSITPAFHLANRTYRHRFPCDVSSWIIWGAKILSRRRAKLWRFHLLLLLLLLLLLQFSFQSVAVVLTLVQTEQIISIHNKTIQNAVNMSAHITVTPTYYKTHTSQNKLQQPQYKIHTTWDSHNTVKYPQYNITLMYSVFCTQELHRNRVSSLDITSLIYAQSPLAVTCL